MTSNTSRAKQFKSRKFDLAKWDALHPDDRAWLSSLPIFLQWPYNSRISPSARAAIKEKIAKSTLEVYGPDHPQSYGWAQRQDQTRFTNLSTQAMLAELGL